MAGNKIIKIGADKGNLPQARAFVEKILGKRFVNASIASDAMLLFEALFREIVSQVDDSSAELEISRARKLGHTDIKMTFPGKRFSLHEGDVSSNPGAKTIEAFSDKISCSYQGGYNVVRISVSQSAWAFILPNLVAVVAAVIVGIALRLTLGDTGQQVLAEEWITPLEKLFTNAVLMIGAPMTLFSLLKNVTDSFIVAERHSSSRKLFANSVASSAIVIVLALVMGFLVAQSILAASGVTESFDLGFANWSLASAVDQIIPSSIITPFETISPIPMIVVALLIAAALGSMGQTFSTVKRAIDVCYDLFSNILKIVMAAFPVACFLLFLHILLAKGGITVFLEILYIAVIVFVCTVPVLIVYALKLRVRGIPLREFIGKLWPLVKENIAIGSVIDAVPFNTQYCEKNLGIKRQRLEKELPVLAQTSLDGNCFILMLLATIYIFIANCDVSWINIAVIAIIVLFLSFGAPNQPGSILIGMLIILAYLHSDIAVSLAPCFELFCGGLQNILNVISSVVTVAENECREEKHPSA
ncbi:MAG: dicarboxylate/amino acid:cation symporter [Coriobacteriales bacterium]|jgi:Na+/H+-dicarboxylate symporter